MSFAAMRAKEIAGSARGYTTNFAGNRLGILARAAVARHRIGVCRAPVYMEQTTRRMTQREAGCGDENDGDEAMHE